MTWISIPEDWTGDQALAAVEFLDEISALIWSKHQLKMLDAYHRRYEPGDEPEADEQILSDVDFPF